MSEPQRSGIMPDEISHANILLHIVKMQAQVEYLVDEVKTRRDEETEKQKIEKQENKERDNRITALENKFYWYRGLGFFALFTIPILVSALTPRIELGRPQPPAVQSTKP